MPDLTRGTTLIDGNPCYASDLHALVDNSVISPAAVSNSKMANMLASTIKGAVVNGAPQDLTMAQARQLLQVELSVTQTAHGFAVGTPLRYTGSSWVAAQANTLAASQVWGVVRQVLDANTFTLAAAGQIINGSGYTAGSTYYLSAATAGALTTTPPSLAVPILFALSSSTVLVIIENLAALQPATYGTDTGAVNAYAVTPSPAAGSLIAGVKCEFRPANSNTGASTLNYNGLGAIAIQAGASGLSGGQLVSTVTAQLIYDGTVWQLLNPQGSTSVQVPVRQTVLAGPIDANGIPSFLPATSASLGITAQNISGSAPLVVAAAGGFGIAGAINRIGQTLTNPAWSSFIGAQTVNASTSTTTTVTISTGSAHNLIVGAEVNLVGFVPAALNGRWIVASVPTSTTFTFVTPTAAGATTTIGTYIVSNFLFVDVNTDGSLTQGNNLLPPIYQQGGTRSIVSGQFTYNIAEMYASVGNGTTAPQNYRVYVGEVQCNSSSVVSSAAYAYQGLSVSALNSTLPGVTTLLTSSDNLGVAEKTTIVEMICTGAEYTYLPGDIVTNVSTQIVAGNAFVLLQFWTRRTTANAYTGGTNGFVIVNTGGYSAPTSGKWSYRYRTRRNW